MYITDDPFLWAFGTNLWVQNIMTQAGDEYSGTLRPWL